MGTPNYPKDLPSEFNRMKRDIRNAFTSANLRTGMAKIGAKIIEITGELNLNPGAILSAQYDNGTNALFVGQTIYNDAPRGHVAIRRYDGSLALWVFGGPNDPGYFSIRDREENIILSDDSVTSRGLARPWIPYTTQETPKILTPSLLVTSSTYTAAHTVAGVMQHPRIKATVYLQTTGTDVGQWRLTNPTTGVVLGTSATSTGGWSVIEASHDNYVFGEEFKYDLEVRRVSGTSTGVGITPTSVYGRQS